MTGALLATEPVELEEALLDEVADELLDDPVAGAELGELLCSALSELQPASSTSTLVVKARDRFLNAAVNVTGSLSRSRKMSRADRVDPRS